MRNNQESYREEPYFTFDNDFAKGIINKTINFKHKEIDANTTFSVDDLEFYKINALNN